MGQVEKAAIHRPTMDKDGAGEAKEPLEPPVQIKQEPKDDIKGEQSDGGVAEEGPSRPSSISEPDVGMKRNPSTGVSRNLAKIKDFAENTMNELLGWYGYDKVDSQDTEHLNLQRFTGGDSPAHTSRSASPDPREDLLHDSLSDDSIDSTDRLTTGSPDSGSELASQHQALVSALSSSRSPSSIGQPGIPDGPLPSGYIVCAWCQKPGIKLFTLKSSGGSKAFCSELCFTQCRRASFKKNKVCDWCKHVRHTVNYVDFQRDGANMEQCRNYRKIQKTVDGEQQLQFCSDKCLNQYKMNIFCKETQEHLQQIQVQMEAGVIPNVPTNNQIMITPELWMEGKGHKKSDKVKDVENQDMPLNLEFKRGDNKEDISNGKVTVLGKRERAASESDIKFEEDGGSEAEKSYSVSEKKFKIDRERLRRFRSRDSSSTPLSVTTSPGSSQLSTPNSCSSNLTPPMMNGSSMAPSVPNPNPFLGALNAGALAHNPFLLHSLFGGGLPGGLPPGLMVNPEQQNRPPVVRITPTPDSGNNPRSSSQPTSSTPVTSSTTSKLHRHTPLGIPGVRPPIPGLFPPMPAPGFLPPGFPLPGAFPPGLMAGNPLGGMMPPATLMVPYPVLIPLPIPVPIPIPVPKEGFEFLFPKKESPIKVEVPKQPEIIVSSPEEPVAVGDDAGVPATPTGETKTTQKIACACCQSRSQPDGHCANSVVHPNSTAACGEAEIREASRVIIKKPMTDSECSVITSSSDLEDVVIDLSKDKHNHGTTDGGVSMIPMLDQNKNCMGLRTTPSSTGSSESTVITNSLMGTLQTVNGSPIPPPRDHAYSSRRALLLDAPSIPRDHNRSPSPERRLLLRNPTRDVLFGKRRCLRTRIKTK